jgi:hypothetical protein
MSFSEKYPELSQWLTHGGLLQVRPASPTHIEALLGDAGGYPNDGSCTASTIDELFAAVEQKVAIWRPLSYRLQQQILAEPEGFESESEIRVTGWPPIQNPRYDPTALPPGDGTE